MISGAAVDALYRLVLRNLSQREMPPVETGEGEAAFTRRAITPIVEAILNRASVSGLLLGGQYTGVKRPVRYLGADFHPDIAILERERRLIAVEVKFLRAADRSGLVSKSIGQSTVYQLAGYKRCITMLLDTASRLNSQHLKQAAGFSARSGTFAVVVRVQGRAGFRPGTIFYPAG